jgi:predicted dehydrogenase
MDFSYHIPAAEWKHTRSLLLDHYPHEIDFLRFLLGDMPTEVWKLHDAYDLYSVVGKMGGVTFNCMGTRRLDRRAFPEEIRLRFDRGSCAINTETGVATLADHEHNSTTLEVAGKTDYTLRVEGVMQDFRRLVDGQGSTLTLTDLEVNTASAIALAARGYYATY